ncbi:hypothetical protein [Pontibacter lucknowensis]|uniref:Lipocalin-like domain-containing protein n=1 Tax=Pontibacter lucknowensis TaxID=1077936 RepID=A0A1N6Y1M0_9BACT|nr:hypothetical protein [Pontibacter lucknowensis]SIR08436.1 hypothetical protein SAMN05421545_2203 [Pontibacter lucknowensis]
MKTFKNNSWLLLLFLFLFSSCKDEQQILNNLEGAWQVTGMTHLKPSAEALPTRGVVTFKKCQKQNDTNDCPGDYVFDDKPTVSNRFSVLEKGKIINFASFTQQAYEHADKLYILQGPYKVIGQSSTRLELEGIMTIGDKATGPVLAEVRIVLER